MSWLKAEQERNIWYIVVTLDVSQLSMSWLNEDAPLNNEVVSVTLDTSHESISPYVFVAVDELLVQALTAVKRSELLAKTYGGVGVGAGVEVGAEVGDHVGASVRQLGEVNKTPQSVSVHIVPVKGWMEETEDVKHQPRSWLKELLT